MHNILLEYKPGVWGSGFLALSKKYQVQGGSKLISEWYKKWDGTESSLRKQSGGDVRSILTPKEKKLHIRNFVTKKKLPYTQGSRKTWRRKQGKIFHFGVFKRLDRR